MKTSVKTTLPLKTPDKTFKCFPFSNPSHKPVDCNITVHIRQKSSISHHKTGGEFQQESENPFSPVKLGESELIPVKENEKRANWMEENPQILTKYLCKNMSGFL